MLLDIGRSELYLHTHPGSLTNLSMPFKLTIEGTVDYRCHQSDCVLGHSRDTKPSKLLDGGHRAMLVLFLGLSIKARAMGSRSVHEKNALPVDSLPEDSCI